MIMFHNLVFIFVISLPALGLYLGLNNNILAAIFRPAGDNPRTARSGLSVASGFFVRCRTPGIATECGAPLEQPGRAEFL